MRPTPGERHPGPVAPEEARDGLVPPPPQQSDPHAEAQAWFTHAVETYAMLARGDRAAAWEPDDLRWADLVFLDAQARLASFYSLDAVPPDPVWCLVPPSFLATVACSMLAKAQADRAWARAVARAAPQWRDHAPARVLVTADATWCQVHGTWQAYPHAAISEYRVDGDCVVFTAQGCAPRALTGPMVWTHAVLLAYLHPGSRTGRPHRGWARSVPRPGGERGLAPAAAYLTRERPAAGPGR